MLPKEYLTLKEIEELEPVFGKYENLYAPDFKLSGLNRKECKEHQKDYDEWISEQEENRWENYF